MVLSRLTCFSVEASFYSTCQSQFPIANYNCVITLVTEVNTLILFKLFVIVSQKVWQCAYTNGKEYYSIKFALHFLKKNLCMCRKPIGLILRMNEVHDQVCI